jgi:hypothetical protein
MTRELAFTKPVFAALEVTTDRIVDACLPRHRHQGSCVSFNRSPRSTPSPEERVADSHATYKHSTNRAWLAKNPRDHHAFHSRPVAPGSTWSNASSRSSPDKAIRRGAFISVADLTAAIDAYIDGWKEQAAPFT